MRRILACTLAVAACGKPDTDLDTDTFEFDTDIESDTDTPDGELALATTSLGGAPYFGGTGLVVADGYAVWIAARGDILRVPIDGGEVTTLVTGQNNVGAVAVSAERIWWSTLSELQSSDLAGADVSEHAGIGGPTGLAATDEGVVVTANMGGLYAVSAGSEPELLSSDDPWSAGVAVAGGDIYWANQGEWPEFEGSIWELADGESRRVAIAEGQATPTSVVVQGGYVWWTNAGNSSAVGSLSRAPLAGGAVEVVVEDQTDAAGIAAGGDYVCWTIYGSLEGTPSAVRCVPVAGGDLVEIASGISVESAVACDEMYVYWGDGTTLWRTPLP